MTKKIGVLALQGGVQEHIAKLRELGAEPKKVRFPEDLQGLDGMILPGGESTCIKKLLRDLGLSIPLRDKIAQGLPTWGTCAGAILLSSKIDQQQNDSPIALLEMDVSRNAYGSQLESFIHELPSLPGKLDKESQHRPVRLVFIRAPKINSLGQEVEPLLTIEPWQQQNSHQQIVAAQKDNIFVTTFHPELDQSLDFHSYFIQLC